MKKIIILMLLGILGAGVLANNAIGQQSGAGAAGGQGLTAEQNAQIIAIRQAANHAAAEARTRSERAGIMRRMQDDIQAVIAKGATPAAKKQTMGTNRAKPMMPMSSTAVPKNVDELKGSCMQQIGLSEEQKAQMETITQLALQQAKAAPSPEEKQTILEKMEEDLMAVLTEEQAAQLELCRAEARDPNRPLVGNCMEQLNLSTEQKRTIEAIRQQAMIDVEGAMGREAKMEIIEKMQQDVLRVLDPNQLAQLQGCRESARNLFNKLFSRFDVCLKKMNLTMEQKSLIQSIRITARQQLVEAKLAGERRRIIERMRDDIINTLDEMQAMELKDCLNMPAVMGPEMK